MGRRRSGSDQDEAADAPPPNDRLVIGQGLADTPRLGGLLRQTRRQLGLSAQEVAEKLKVTGSYIRAIERGDRAPAPELAEDLFETLGFTVHPQDEHAGDPADLVVKRGDRQWFVEFKHLARPAADTAALARLAQLLHAETDGSTAQDGSHPSGRPRALANAVTTGIGAVTAAWPGRAAGLDAAIGRVVRQLPVLDVQTLNAVARLLEDLARLDEARRRQAVEQMSAAAAVGSRTPEDRSPS